MQYNDLIAQVVNWTWIVFILVWIISAVSAKRTARGASGRMFLYRIIIGVIIYLIIRYTGLAYPLILSYIHNETVRWIGAILVILGMMLAFWARFHLGRNWGMPMTEKEGAELVTTGPYAYIRNPIYTAILIAIIGSSLVFGALWTVILVIYAAYFIPSIFVEEKIMLRLFPNQYPAYKARTKRLIPWVW